jgi:hypothetical protein
MQQSFKPRDFFNNDTKQKAPYRLIGGFQKKGDDILSHKMQYHLRWRA